ncbi:hypothetical protein R5R35_013109 [Gryllus longicercus]|uniref:Uncharacterized protein n=1 Tax=Gryllus longicercus TaxID=2509291 RepID=A0AAN9ZGW5_9ORTH
MMAAPAAPRRDAARAGPTGGGRAGRPAGSAAAGAEGRPLNAQVSQQNLMAHAEDYRNRGLQRTTDTRQC